MLVLSAFWSVYNFEKKINFMTYAKFIAATSLLASTSVSLQVINFQFSMRLDFLEMASSGIVDQRDGCRPSQQPLPKSPSTDLATYSSRAIRYILGFWD